MENDILFDLYYGKITPWENTPEDADEFRNLNRQISKLSDELDERLNEESLSLLEQYLDVRADLENLLSFDSFKTGVRIGIQLILAALNTP